MRETERGNEKQLIFFYGKLAKFSITSGYVEQEKEREGKEKQLIFFYGKLARFSITSGYVKEGKDREREGTANEILHGISILTKI